MKAKLLSDDHGQKTFALIFDTGDSVVPALLAFARERRLAASHFTAIGAFQELVLGYFDWQKKEYKHIPLREQVEVVSLVGDIAEDEKGEPKVHAHLVVGRSDGSAMAGHLVEACVRPTLELMLTESPQRLQRKYDPESGLALIRF
jgi:uncharacterized protein